VVPPGRGVEAQTADGLLAFVFCLFFFIFIFFGVVACRMRSLSLVGRPGEASSEMVRCPCLLPAIAFFFTLSVSFSCHSFFFFTLSVSFACHCFFSFRVRTGLTVVRMEDGLGAQTADALLVFFFGLLS